MGYWNSQKDFRWQEKRRSIQTIFWMVITMLAVSIDVFSQTSLTDSLKKAFGTASGTAKTDLLNRLGKEYWYGNHDSSVYYSSRALLQAREQHYDKGEAEAFRSLGMANIGDTLAARTFFYKGLLIFMRTADQKGMADTYNNLGLMWSPVNYPAALICYDSSLLLFRKIHDTKGEGAVLNYINIVYQFMGDYQKAVDYALQGLEVRKSTNDHNGIIYSYYNVARVYSNGGQPQSAIKFYNESIAYAVEHHIKPLPVAYDGLAECYLQLGQFEEAKKWLLSNREWSNHLLLGRLYYATNQLDSAMNEYRKSIGSSGSDFANSKKASAMIGISKILLKRNEINPSLQYAKNAYTIASSGTDRLTLAESAAQLGFLMEKTGDYRRALLYSRQSSVILDSVHNLASETYQRKLAAFESKSELEKQQADIKILSVEKELQKQKLDGERTYRNTILAASILVLIISILIIRSINGKRKKIQAQKNQIDIQKSKAEKALEELKATQSQLIQSEKMASLGELTAGIAHEIQNPLNFVNNFSEINQELLLEMKEEMGKANIDELKQMTDDIIGNEGKILFHGRRADSIVKSMLQHSQTSTGRKEPTDLNIFAAEWLRLSYHGFCGKDKAFHAVLETHLDPGTGSIPVIPQEIGSVLLNLFNNAFYSVREKKKKSGEIYEPVVTLSTRRVGDQIEIRVRDNGEGILPAIIQKIFQPFFTTKPTGQGTGLGLSLSYDMIKAHGGVLKAESGEGEGAEFIILLPTGS